MNRRHLLKRGAQAAIGSAAIIGSARLSEGASRSIVIENPNTQNATIHSAECNLCPFTEDIARRIMDETGDWKETIRDRRNGANPIVVTRHGCCCCEVTLAKGARHPDWTYRMRSLTAEEKRTFHEEYGNVASLLIGVGLGDKYSIRGFILNGRREGWHLSAEKI